MWDPSIGIALLSCLTFAFFLHVFFVVTTANSWYPIAASIHPGANLSAQIIPHTIKLQPLPVCRREMDYKVIEIWVYSVNNYFALTGLTGPSQWAYFAAILI